MKRIVLVAAVVLSVTALTYAADNHESEKDWCLLGVANKCPTTTTIDLVDKIKRLETATNKGSAVYTPEETKHLQAMLEEAFFAREILFNKR